MLVLINGPSSAGKTSVARALQKRLAKPFLLYGIDHVSDCIPPHFRFDSNAFPREWPEPDGSAPAKRSRKKKAPAPEITADQWLRDARRMAGELARRGYNLILDEVLTQPARLEDYLAVFEGLEVYTVGLECSLEVLEAREAARPDRSQGEARRTYDRVHQYCEYDLLLDSADLTPEACAQLIAERISSAEPPQAFERMRQNGVRPLGARQAAQAARSDSAEEVDATPAQGWSAEQARKIAAQQPLLSPEGFQLLGQAFWLCQFSPLKARNRFFVGHRHILPAIAYNQFRLYKNRTGNGPIAFASWAWLSDETQEEFRLGRRLLEPEDWRAGKNLWIVEIIAPFGDEEFVLRDLTEKALPKDVGRWLKPVPRAPGGAGFQEIVVAGRESRH